MAMASDKGHKRCAESHRQLVIPGGNGKEYKITGGSVYAFKPDRFDVVISFEGSYRGSEMALPWTSGVEFTYRISDGSAPGNPKNFKQLVGWVAERLQEGDKVFCGCIGGHGRTGLFLAALVAHMTGEKDAIQYVRDNYCQKAVESETQVKFLGKHFGVKARDPSKPHYGGGWSGRSKNTLVDVRTDDYFTVDDLWKPGEDWKAPENRVKSSKSKSQNPGGSMKGKAAVRILEPIPVNTSIHGDNEIV